MMMVSCFFFFFSSRRRHTRFDCDWSSDVCSSDLHGIEGDGGGVALGGWWVRTAMNEPSGGADDGDKGGQKSGDGGAEEPRVFQELGHLRCVEFHTEGTDDERVPCRAPVRL